MLFAPFQSFVVGCDAFPLHEESPGKTGGGKQLVALGATVVGEQMWENDLLLPSHACWRAARECGSRILLEHY